MGVDMRSGFAIAMLAAGGILLVGGCSQDKDECAAYSEACSNWCEGDGLEACLADADSLIQEGDQNACYDAHMSLACESYDDDDSGWDTGW